VVLVEEPSSADQDRVRTWMERGRIVVALADGAGGTGFGSEAADAFVAAIDRARPLTRGAAISTLTAIDRDLRASGRGQTAGVVFAIDARGDIEGASAGDCEVIARSEDRWYDLTEGRARKPLLGAGAHPAPFALREAELVLAATDGLFKYAPRARIEASLLRDEGASNLPELVRLRSGTLPDDLAAAIVRRA
jgi:hypothetical protein